MDNDISKRCINDRIHYLRYVYAFNSVSCIEYARIDEETFDTGIDIM